MSYNDDNKGKHEGHKHNPLKHMLHMILCCGLPLVIVAFLPLISRISPSASNAVSRIVPFICPLMMIPMMFMMMSGSGNGNKKKSCCENTNEENETKKIDAKEIV